MVESGWVTVIIPTYNRAHLIGDTIKSVFDQTYGNWDIIVVDDGSTDNTADVVKQFPSDRVTYVSVKHSGLPAVARNVGIRLAKGEYIAFLDSDDLWLPRKLALQIDLLGKRPEAGLVCADAYVLDEDQTNQANRTIWDGKVPPSGRVFGELYSWNFVHTSTVIVRRQCFDNVGYFDERPIFVIAQDYHLWLRIAACYDVVVIRESLIRYRFHEARHCNNKKEHVNSSVIRVLLDIRDQYPELVAHLGKKADRRVEDVYENMGCCALRLGQPLAALRAFEQAAIWKHCRVPLPVVRGLSAFGLTTAKTVFGKILDCQRSMRNDLLNRKARS